jgi:predicted PurR-regulated permease PerM
VPKLSDKKVVVGTVRSIEGQLSSYISTISMINVVFGAAVAGVMALIGVENPILLGCLAAALNFLPFLGALTMIICLAATSLLQHDGFSGALLPPVAYLILHLIESWVVSPLLLGKRFTLNPVILFIWLLLWTWLWGIPGALLAVPLLVTLKIVCENIPTLQAYKTFLE